MAEAPGPSTDWVIEDDSSSSGEESDVGSEDRWSNVEEPEMQADIVSGHVGETAAQGIRRVAAGEELTEPFARLELFAEGPVTPQIRITAPASRSRSSRPQGDPAEPSCSTPTRRRRHPGTFW